MHVRDVFKLSMSQLYILKLSIIQALNLSWNIYTSLLKKKHSKKHLNKCINTFMHYIASRTQAQRTSGPRYYYTLAIA